MNVMTKPLAGDSVELCGYTFDLWRRELCFGDKKIRLSDPEAVMFRAIAEARGEFVSRKRLCKVWAEYRDVRAESVLYNTLSAHICRLRAKMKPLGGRLIETEWKLGYRL